MSDTVRDWCMRECGAYSIQNDRVLVPHPKLAALLDRITELERENARYRSAIKWALGEEGEFPSPDEEPPPIAGKYRRRYFWRDELRRRASIGLPEGEK